MPPSMPSGSNEMMMVIPMYEVREGSSSPAPHTAQANAGEAINASNSEVTRAKPV